MDEEYIVDKLIKLCSIMYFGEPFAKYSKRRNKYIFGSILPFGEVKKSIVHPSIAIYLVCGQLPKRRRK